MIEAAMYIALGFFLAVLLSLAIIPAIYKRAVRLTQEAMKAVNPTTYAEVRSAQDYERAQHALAIRKVERALEEAREEATASKTKAGELRAELIKQHVRFEAEQTELENSKSENETGKSKRAKLATELNKAREKLAETEQALAAAHAEIDVLKANSADIPNWMPAEDTMALATITGMESQIATLKAQLAKYEAGELGSSDETVPDDADGLKALVKALEGQLVDVETKYISAQAEVTRLTLQADLTDEPRDETLERVERDLKWAEAEKARLTALTLERERALVRASSQIRRLRQDLKSAPEMAELRQELLSVGEKVAASSAQPASKRKKPAKASSVKATKPSAKTTRKQAGKTKDASKDTSSEAAKPTPVSTLVDRIVKSSQANTDVSAVSTDAEGKTSPASKDKKRDVA